MAFHCWALCVGDPNTVTSFLEARSEMQASLHGASPYGRAAVSGSPGKAVPVPFAFLSFLLVVGVFFPILG